MLKEFLADFKRYRTDRVSNASPVQVLTGKWNRAYQMTDGERQKHEAVMQKYSDIPNEPGDMRFDTEERLRDDVISY